MTGLSYDTLKFYCNKGLIPHVKRDQHNYRIFDQQDIEWIHSLLCLRKCGMPIRQMKRYLELCLKGPDTIQERQKMLSEVAKELKHKRQEIEESLSFIAQKQAFYQDVLSGQKPYFSYLLPEYADHPNPFDPEIKKD